MKKRFLAILSVMACMSFCFSPVTGMVVSAETADTAAASADDAVTTSEDDEATPVSEEDEATPVSEEKEPTDTPAPGQGGSSYRGGGYGGSSGGSSTGTSSPKTGDTSDMALWQCLLLMAIAGILATSWKLQKRKNK